MLINGMVLLSQMMKNPWNWANRYSDIMILVGRKGFPIFPYKISSKKESKICKRVFQIKLINGVTV